MGSRHAIITKIQRFSIHDGPGIRSTVFIKGCPMECLWCHNPETQDPEPQSLQNSNGGDEIVGKYMSVDELMSLVERDTMFFAETGGGITFSGGEPLTQSEFVACCLSSCEKLGIHTAIDTSGCVPQSAVARVMKDTGLFLYDIKCADDGLHKKLTGVSNVRILENLRYLVDSGARVEVRMPLIAELNDKDVDIDSACRVLEDCGVLDVKLLPYHSIGEYKYGQLGRKYQLHGARAPTNKRMRDIARKLSERGFNVLGSIR